MKLRSSSFSLMTAPLTAESRLRWAAARASLDAWGAAAADWAAAKAAWTLLTEAESYLPVATN